MLVVMLVIMVLDVVVVVEEMGLGNHDDSQQDQDHRSSVFYPAAKVGGNGDRNGPKSGAQHQAAQGGASQERQGEKSNSAALFGPGYEGGQHQPGVPARIDAVDQAQDKTTLDGYQK